MILLGYRKPLVIAALVSAILISMDHSMGQSATPKDSQDLPPTFICDGKTDNASAFDRAIDDAGHGSGQVVLPPATAPCLTSKPMRIRSAITLTAMPGTVTIEPTVGSTENPLLLSIVGANNVLVHGIVFDGGGKNTESRNPVATIYKSDRVVFDDVRWQNTRGIAVVFSTQITHSGVQNSSLENVGIQYERTHEWQDHRQGIAFCCGNQGESLDNFVRNTTFSHVGLDAISIGNQTGFIVSNNQFRNVGGTMDRGGAAIWTFDVKGLTVSHNMSRDAAGNGLDITHVVDATINDNDIQRSGGGGITISSSHSVKVASNICSDNWQSHGIEKRSSHRGGIVIDTTNPPAQPSSDITISANTCTDTQNPKTQRWGLQLRGSIPVPGLQVEQSNKFYGNALGEIGSE